MRGLKAKRLRKYAKTLSEGAPWEKYYSSSVPNRFGQPRTIVRLSEDCGKYMYRKLKKEFG